MGSVPLHSAGIHVGIIMDGNGRWAEARGRRRTVGHREGARTLRRVVEAAPAAGIDTLTLYAFSSDNWKRPAAEVSALMALFRRHLRTEIDDLIDRGVRLTVIGRRDRLVPGLVESIARAEEATRGGSVLRLRLAVDYSARDAIVTAARRAATDMTCSSDTQIAPSLDREGFAALLGGAVNEGEAVRDLDLLIRTGGEQRLSDFLLWEAAYAELYFTPVMWPDFDGGQLARAVAAFRARNRRFGRVVEQAG